MTRTEFEKIIEEEIINELNGLNEKSVPEPYDRKSEKVRKMTDAQKSKREEIFDKLSKKKKLVKKFKKDYGEDWESYLWATATNAAIIGKDVESGGEEEEGGETSPAKGKEKKSSEKTSTTGKLTPAQRRTADSMYRQLLRMAKKDEKSKRRGLKENSLLNYVNKLEQKFSLLSENTTNFDVPLMTKILHKIAEKLMVSGEQK